MSIVRQPSLIGIRAGSASVKVRLAKACRRSTLTSVLTSCGTSMSSSPRRISRRCVYGWRRCFLRGTPKSFLRPALNLAQICQIWNLIFSHACTQYIDCRSYRWETYRFTNTRSFFIRSQLEHAFAVLKHVFFSDKCGASWCTIRMSACEWCYLLASNAIHSEVLW